MYKRQVVDRAKCCLISFLRMDEAQAHRYIQKRAMDMRVTQREVAEDILKDVYKRQPLARSGNSSRPA